MGICRVHTGQTHGAKMSAQALAQRQKLKKPQTPSPTASVKISIRDCRTCHNPLGGGHQCTGACLDANTCPLKNINPQKHQLCTKVDGVSINLLLVH
jgi:hypothetical protein